MTTTKTFNGFGLFSDFLAALDKSLPVNCMAVKKTNPGKHGTFLCTTVVITSQAQPKGVIYHQYTTAKWQQIGDTPLDDTHADRADSAYELTLKLLDGYKVYKALTAMPKNLETFDGQNDLLRWDKEVDLFYLREDPNETPTAP